MKSTLFTLFLVMSLLAVPAAVSAAPSADDYGPQAQPQSTERFYVELTVTDGATALALSRLIPEWDEVLEAGSGRVVLDQKQIDMLRAAGYTLHVIGRAPDLPTVWPSCYNRLTALYTWLYTYAAAHPSLVEIIDYGDSWCKQHGGCATAAGVTIPGYDLLVAKVTNRAATGPKTGRFFTDGGIHAREIPTPELGKLFIETLVSGYGVNPNVTMLLDQREIYVVLTSNPDGRALVEMGVDAPYNANPWYWRKNGNSSITGSAACAWPATASSHYGIDLNRNHIFKWDAPGHSDYVCDQEYRGPSAGSESEILAYENFVRSIIPDQRGPGDTDPAPLDATGFLINWHNTAGAILVPWGWTTTTSPNDAQLVAIAQKMGSTMSTPYGWQYALYPVSGNTRDWAYGELGIPAYVIELTGNDFFTSCTTMPGIINNMLPLLLYASNISDVPYRRVYGPDARSVTATPATLPSGNMLTVTAQINDTQNGNQTITGAEVFLVRQGGPTPGDPGYGTAMTPSDGTFNSTIEAVQATLSTAGLGRGRYLAQVRGRDAGNNWGPLSAASFQVTCFFADLNCSGVVDVADITLAATGLMNYWQYGAFDAVYDVNNNGAGDGFLNVSDVQIIASYFGYTVP